MAGVSEVVSYCYCRGTKLHRLGDIVNDWRTHRLGIEPVPGTEGHRLLDVLEVPFTYCWSPSLVAKPEDWGSHIGETVIHFKTGYIYLDHLAKTKVPRRVRILLS